MPSAQPKRRVPREPERGGCRGSLAATNTAAACAPRPTLVLQNQPALMPDHCPRQTRRCGRADHATRLRSSRAAPHHSRHRCSPPWMPGKVLDVTTGFVEIRRHRDAGALVDTLGRRSGVCAHVLMIVATRASFEIKRTSTAFAFQRNGTQELDATMVELGDAFAQREGPVVRGVRATNQGASGCADDSRGQHAVRSAHAPRKGRRLPSPTVDDSHSRPLCVSRWEVAAVPDQLGFRAWPTGNL